MLAVTLLSFVATGVRVLPLLVTGVIYPPSKLIVSPSLYVKSVGCVVIEILAIGSVTVNVIFVVKL